MIKLWNGGKGILGIALGTFLSLQIAPTVSLAVYTNLMTPWANAERITDLEKQVFDLERRLQEHIFYTE